MILWTRTGPAARARYVPRGVRLVAAPRGADRDGRTERPDEMNQFDGGQWIWALMTAAAALFVLSGSPPASRWRHRFRGAAIALYAAAAAAAVLAIALWLMETHH